MGKNLKGKECGKNIRRRMDGFWYSKRRSSAENP